MNKNEKYCVDCKHYFPADFPHNGSYNICSYNATITISLVDKRKVVSAQYLYTCEEQRFKMKQTGDVCGQEGKFFQSKDVDVWVGEP